MWLRSQKTEHCIPRPGRLSMPHQKFGMMSHMEPSLTFGVSVWFYSRWPVLNYHLSLRIWPHYQNKWLKRTSRTSRSATLRNSRAWSCCFWTQILKKGQPLSLCTRSSYRALRLRRRKRSLPYYLIQKHKDRILQTRHLWIIPIKWRKVQGPANIRS